MLVPNIMALDNPWNILNIIREVMLPENTIRNVEIVNNRMPREKIFFLPIMSASRPNGRRNMAEERIKLLITQPSPIALAWRSFPIEGKARLTEELRNGTRKAAKVATKSIDFFEVFSSVISGFIYS
jgi:hypothetical protein